MKQLLWSAVMLLSALHLGAQTPDKSSVTGKAFHRIVFEVNVPGQPTGPQILDMPLALDDITLIAGRDTLRQKMDRFGAFTFENLVPGLVTFSIDEEEYVPFSETVELMPGENVVFLYLEERTETLDAAVARAEVPVMTMKGDTLVYHASKMAVGEGDFAIDLLKRMPGVEVRDGQIQVAGKSVRRSYVNGALVFGLDPMASMENLKADQVVAMEVYDEKDPQEILDGIGRDEQRVINIRTREPVFSTTDLQARALAGADQHRKEDGSPQYRYALGANAHFFSELKQLTADFVTNNADLRSSNINLAPGPQSLYRETTDVKIGFNRFWHNPLTGNVASVSYSYGHEWTRSSSRRLQEYFETADIPGHVDEEDFATSSLVDNHNLHIGAAYRTGKRATIQWTQDLRLAHERADSRRSGSTAYAGMSPMLQDERTHEGDRSWTLDENVRIGLRSRSGKARPTLDLSLQLGRNNLDAWNLDTLSSSYSRRYLTKEGEKLFRTWSGILSQTLYNFRKGRRSFQLTGSYTLHYSFLDREQQACDWKGMAGEAVNPANTFDFTYSAWSHRFSLQSRSSTGRNFFPNLNVGVTLEMDRIRDRERLPASDAGNRTYYSILPSLGFKTGILTWNFGSSVRLPAVEQIRRRIDDTRPLSLLAGNPDLRPIRSWTAEVGKKDIIGTEKWMVTWDLTAQYERNPIVQRTLFFDHDASLDEYDGYRVPAGASLLRFENADHALDTRLSLSASSLQSLLDNRLNFNILLQPAVAYRQTPQYFGSVLDRMSEWTAGIYGVLAFPLWQGAQASVAEDFSYLRASSKEGKMDRKAIRGKLDVSLTADFAKLFYFAGDYSWQPLKDLTDINMSREIHRLNVAVGVNLLKKTLKIGIRGVDLLRGGSIYNVTMGPSSMTYTWTPVYGRYFLLDISYRFNNSGKVMTGRGI